MKIHKIKRISIIAITIILFFVVQTAVIRYFELASISPNLLVILVSSFGFMRGRKQGMFVGLAVGILYDIFYSELLGLSGLIYMLIGYLNGLFRRLFFDDDIKLPLLLIGISDLIYSIYVFFVMFLLRSRFDLPYYFQSIIIPELVYTLLASLCVYPIVRMINRKLEFDKKRSTKNFV